MSPKWKTWLSAASVLLLVGAGCAGTADIGAGVQSEASGTAEEGKMMAPKTDADAAVDAYLEGAMEENAAAESEDADAQLYNSTDAEVNAYGNTYDKSELQ